MPQHDNKSQQFLARYQFFQLGASPAGTTVVQDIDTINWYYPNGIVFVPRFYIQFDTTNNPFSNVFISKISEGDSNTVPLVEIDSNRLIGSYAATQNNSRTGNLITGATSLKNSLGVIGKFKRYIGIELQLATAVGAPGCEIGVDIIFSPNYFPVDVSREISKL